MCPEAPFKTQYSRLCCCLSQCFYLLSFYSNLLSCVFKTIFFCFSQYYNWSVHATNCCDGVALQSKLLYYNQDISMILGDKYASCGFTHYSGQCQKDKSCLIYCNAATCTVLNLGTSTTWSSHFTNIINHIMISVKTPKNLTYLTYLKTSR